MRTQRPSALLVHKEHLRCCLDRPLFTCMYIWVFPGGMICPVSVQIGVFFAVLVFRRVVIEVLYETM